MGILEVLERLQNKYGLDFYELTKSKKQPMKDVYSLTLRTNDERERRELVWFPTDKCRQEFLKRARKNGLEVIFNAIIDNTV